MGAYGAGFKTVWRSWGLVILLWLANLGLAALLAVPLAARLRADFRGTASGPNMMYGFDYPWWSHWSSEQSGWAATFRPDTFGGGLAWKNLDLLLRGQLPARLFAFGSKPDDPVGDPDGIILGLGLLYLLVQTFLLGGVLGVFRAPQGHWTLRGVLHGSGFYFGRLVRVVLLALLLDWLVFRLNLPFGRWADGHAREAVSGWTATLWLLGRHALLLLVLLGVHMLSGYAKVIVVLEERGSAVLAFLSSLMFCLRHPFRTAGHYLGVVATGVVLLAGWIPLEQGWQTTGYKTQLVALLLAQALVVGAIALRLALLGGQMALYRSRSGQ